MVKVEHFTGMGLLCGTHMRDNSCLVSQLKIHYTCNLYT